MPSNLEQKKVISNKSLGKISNIYMHNFIPEDKKRENFIKVSKPLNIWQYKYLS